jgi:glyceraldehyde 3-phosphate dehydrogenase
MAVKVGINGFGRIGRNVLRAIIESGRTDIEVVAINDLGPVETNAHLLRYDSVHGRFPGDGEGLGRHDRRRPRADQGDVRARPEGAALERRRHRARMHRHLHRQGQGVAASGERLEAGPRLGAGLGADKTIVYGVNHDTLGAEDTVVSNASCTTNCLAPVAYVLNNAIGIEKGFMTTIHSYTGDQPTLDTMHKDLYRARAAAMSDDPDLDRRCEGGGPRAARAQRQARRRGDPGADAERLGRRLQVHRLEGDLGRGDQRRDPRGGRGRAEGHPRLHRPRSSSRSDFNHDSHSSVFHMDQTKVMDGTFVRVLTWYDNEWGFSCRMADTAVAMGKLG